MERLPLVLIPGHMGTARDWQLQTEYLADDYEVFIPEHHFNIRSIVDMARDIALRVPERFDLVGWSMGGYIAFELHHLVALRVRKLVLVNTSARPESGAATVRRQELVAAVDSEGVESVYSRELFKHVVDDAALTPEFRHELLAERLRLGSGVLKNQIAAMIGRADARTRLAEIRCPTLMVAGSLDELVPVECAYEIDRSIPNSKLQIFEGVGHCVPWERPAEFNALLKAFLS